MIYFVRICRVPRNSVDPFVGVTEKCLKGNPTRERV
jgi:hypothetical protein